MNIPAAAAAALLQLQQPPVQPGGPLDITSPMVPSLLFLVQSNPELLKDVLAALNQNLQQPQP